MHTLAKLAVLPSIGKRHLGEGSILTTHALLLVGLCFCVQLHLVCIPLWPTMNKSLRNQRKDVCMDRNRGVLCAGLSKLCLWTNQ